MKHVRPRLAAPNNRGNAACARVPQSYPGLSEEQRDLKELRGFVKTKRQRPALKKAECAAQGTATGSHAHAARILGGPD
ncbi:hypothetical protein NDU88_008296 [Pleurodeles waltl]|uniref:Uncharacterized protein n=1 Tax=Pleurodeles waltl TaxID=8319 RepID=A0AAV7NW58_PLEWA|nr:hypothetical protein NDU88_008296 [Pleurodeles waltl]